MAKITYENKVALNVNSDIADVNKCNATDLNEIKNVVNENDDNTTNNSNAIENLSNLNTTNKNNLVGAINEVNTLLGNIVESGSNDNGTWIKWADGTMVIRQSKVHSSSTINTTDGNIYRGNLGTMPDFPVEFIEAPDVFLTLTNAFKLIVAGQEGNPTTKRAFDYEGNPALIGVESATIQTCENVKVNLLAIGKWK